MKTYCPHCEKTTDVEKIEKREKIEVRGETLEVNSRLLKCKVCKQEFDDRESKTDSLDTAYDLYRQKHKMMQPGDITALRERYGLTQVELASLLGWGLVTFSRYENGALQSEAHEKVLRMVERPDILLGLVQKAPDGALSDKRRVDLLKKLDCASANVLENVMLAIATSYEPSDFSGGKSFDIIKFKNVCKFFAKGGVWKTKLNKLLFYFDFISCRYHKRSVTGLRYAAADYGPVPDQYELLYSLLIAKGELRIEEVPMNEDVVGDKLFAVAPVDLDAFSDAEKKILQSVKSAFAKFSARQITDYSHQEHGYKATGIGRLISFEHAGRILLPRQDDEKKGK